MHKPLYWASRLLTIVRRLGMRGAAAYVCKERALRALALVVSTRRLPMTYRLYSPMSSNPLVCRFGTSDRQVFAQIFIFRTYEALDPERSPRFIIDGGANVGYSSIYLLTRFPLAHVLAVEPDERNFELLLQNLASYGRRATALRAAIWSRCTGLILSRGTFGDGREWATEVLECDPASAADVDGFDVETLMTRSGVDRIDILKLDVEGSEIEIFREPGTWLHKVETIAIELHDEECNKTFFRALSSMPFDFVQQGELTFARRA